MNLGRLAAVPPACGRPCAAVVAQTEGTWKAVWCGALAASAAICSCRSSARVVVNLGRLAVVPPGCGRPCAAVVKGMGAAWEAVRVAALAASAADGSCCSSAAVVVNRGRLAAVPPGCVRPCAAVFKGMGAAREAVRGGAPAASAADRSCCSSA